MNRNTPGTQVTYVENSRTNEDYTMLSEKEYESCARSKHTSVTAQLHHQSRISRGSNTTSSEVNDREAFQASSFLEQVEWRLDILRIRIELFLTHHACLPDLAHHRPLVTNSFDNVASTGLTLGSDECSTFRDTTKSFSEITCTAYKRDFESVLVDMVLIISGSKDLGFIDIVDTDGLEDLSLEPT